MSVVRHEQGTVVETRSSAHSIYRRALVLTSVCFLLSATLLVCTFGVEGGIRGRLEEAAQHAGSDSFQVRRAPMAVQGEGSALLQSDCAQFPLSVRSRLLPLSSVAGVAAEGVGVMTPQLWVVPSARAKAIRVNQILIFRPMTPDYFAVRGIPLSSGRSFTSSEARSGALVAVVGAYAFSPVGLPGGDGPAGTPPALGMTFRPTGARVPAMYTVVGVLPKTGDLRVDNAVFVPFGAVPDVDAELPSSEMRLLASGASYTFWVQARPGALETALRDVAAVLASYNGPDGQVVCEPYRIGQVLHQRVRKTVSTGLYITSGLCLLVLLFNATVLLTIYVMMNTRTIGVKRSMGGPRITIVSELVWRAVRLAGVPTLLGVALGLVGAPVLSGFLGETVRPSVASCLGAGAVTAVVAALGALYPSVVACALSPADAVRGRTPWAPRPQVWRDPRGVIAALALAIGVGGVIATSGIGRGAEIRVAAYMREAGADLVRVRPRSAFETLTALALSERVGVEPLGIDERLADEMGRVPGVLRSALIRRIPVTLGAGSGAQAGGTSQPATCFAAAVGPSYCETAHLKLRAGRWFTPSDAGKPVAVLGSTAASQTGKPGAQVGGVVLLGGSTFTVIGLLEARPEGVLDFIVDRNLTVFVPLGSEALIEDFAYQSASTEILVQAVGGEAAESLVRSIPAILAASHPGKAIPVVSRPVGDLAELRAVQARLSRTFDLIAALALAMATLGLANLSLLRTAERSRQIGIHRALGASRWRVVRGCLGETLQLGLVGGVLGGAGAVGVLFAAAALNGWPMVFPLGSAVLAFGLGLAAGFFGGLAPTLDLAFRDPALLLRGNR